MIKCLIMDGFDLLHTKSILVTGGNWIHTILVNCICITPVFQYEYVLGLHHII